MDLVIRQVMNSRAPAIVILFACLTAMTGCDSRSRAIDGVTSLAGQPAMSLDAAASAAALPVWPDTDPVQGPDMRFETNPVAIDTATVDCALRLPCVWREPHGGFDITIVALDATQPDATLRVRFRIATFHDTRIEWHRLYDAIGSRTRRIAVARAGFDDRPPGAAVELLGGSVMTGDVQFQAHRGDARLDLFTIGLLDNGLARTASFTALPVAPPAATRGTPGI